MGWGRTAMRFRCVFILVVFVAAYLFPFLPFPSARNAHSADAPQLKLFQALMCEEIFSNAPRNPTIVFSVEQKKAVCFTSFSEVPQITIIHHNWYHRDVPSAKIRLTLKPPSWSTYSSIQLRETDIGPWRVEITDETGNILYVLRFSVTE